MSTERKKISPAFEPFLSNRDPDARRDAIVIYRAPGVDPGQRRINRRDRLSLSREVAGHQREVEARVVDHYQDRSRDLGHRGTPLNVRSVGGDTLPVVAVEVTQKTLGALAEQPEVLAVLPNQAIHLIEPKRVDFTALVQQEATDGLTWGLKQLNIPKAWETTKGAGVNVAVLDSGVYGDHPALKDRLKNFIVVDPLGRRISVTPSFDSGRHGTHVSGTIVGGKTEDGISIGVAPEANLLVAGVLVGDATLMTLVEGMAWAVENEADIINMSLGLQYYEPLFGKILDLLISRFDVLPVVAIGNENHGNTSSPGNSYNAFSVGAMEKLPNEELGITFFSSGASLVFPGQEPESLVNKPDVAAPGAQVYSCIPPEQRPDGTFAYTYMDGTSMATPHVAGVAALLMAANPDASATDVMKAIRETAAHPQGLERRPDNRWGYGMVQPVEALKLIELA